MSCPHHEIRHGQLQLTPTFSPCVIGPSQGGHIARFRHERFPLCRRTQPHPLVSLSPDIQMCIASSGSFRFCQYSSWHAGAPVLNYQHDFEHYGISPSPDERGRVYPAVLGPLQETWWKGLRFLESSTFGHGNVLPWHSLLF